MSNEVKSQTEGKEVAQATSDEELALLLAKNTELSAKENEAIIKAIDNNWEFINEQIDKTFAGIKTASKKLK